MTSIPYERKGSIKLSETEDFAMRESDWRRIRRTINKLPVQKKMLSNSYSTCFGISFTSGSTALTLYLTASSLNPWVFIILIILALACFFLGLILSWLDKDNSTRLRERIDNFNQDLDDIKEEL